MGRLLFSENELDAGATLVDGPQSLPDLAADDDMEQPAIGVVTPFIGFDVHRFQKRLGVFLRGEDMDIVGTDEDGRPDRHVDGSMLAEIAPARSRSCGSPPRDSRLAA